MNWYVWAKASIGMNHYPEGQPSVEILSEDAEDILAEGPDPEVLAKDFCEKYVIPQALKHGVSTKIDVLELQNIRCWRGIIDIYLMNPSDMFWPPDEIRIFNSEGDGYYPHDTLCPQFFNSQTGECNCRRTPPPRS